MLRDIVIPPSLLTKLLSVAGANVNTSPGASGPFSSPIPWRKAGLRYNKNEIYFDIVEDLKAVIDKYVLFTKTRNDIIEYQSTEMAQQCQATYGARWRLIQNYQESFHPATNISFFDL